MNIAVICNKTSDPERNARHSGYHFAKGFEQIGHKVDIYHWSQKDIPEGYDFYFNVDSSERYSLDVRLYPLLVYNGDTHMPGGLERDMLRCEHAQIIFNGNYENGVELMTLMGLRSIWLPLGYDYRFDFSDKEVENKDIDVAMAGSPNSSKRTELWEWIKQNYPNCLVGNINPSEAYRRAKVVVNQPTEPWDIIYNNRLLEGMVSGAVVLQKKLQVNKHEQLLPPDYYEIWHDYSDLKLKVDAILSDWGTMRSKGIRARNLVKDKYSYRNLAENIISYFLKWKNGTL